MKAYFLILLIALAACCINAQEAHEGSHEGSHEEGPDGDWGTHEGKPDMGSHEGRWPDKDWGSHEGFNEEKHGWGKHRGSDTDENRSKMAVVTFKILKDFNLIKDNMKEFEEVIKGSLITVTGMPREMIKFMKFRPGSIIVEVYLRECRGASGKITTYTAKITEVMTQRGLVFEFGNQMYQVDAQSLKIRHHDDYSAFHFFHHKKVIAVGVGAGGLFMILSIVIGCCVYRKYKRGKPVPFTNLSKVSVSTPSLNGEKTDNLAFIQVPADNWMNEKKVNLGVEPGVVVG